VEKVPWWFKTLATPKLKRNGHSSKYTYKCHMCFQNREPMNCGIFRSLSNIKWTNNQFHFLSYMWLERKEKRKPPTSEKCYIPKYRFVHHWIWSWFTILLWVIEFEVTIHHASEFCQKYRIEVQYQKDFGYLEKMVGINLDLFQSTAIHSDTSLLFPLVLWVPASND
jgi:hypothetical protein